MSWSILLDGLVLALAELPGGDRVGDPLGRIAAARERAPAPWATLLDQLPLPGDWSLTVAERAALAWAAAAETDAAVARLLASYQHPAAGSRPSLGLLLRLADGLDGCADLPTRLLDGPLHRYGLVELAPTDRALIERELRLPPALALAISGRPGAWSSEPAPAATAVPERLLAALRAADDGSSPLLIRARDPADARAAAQLLDARCHLLQPADWHRPGWAAWARLADRRPVLVIDDELPPPPPATLLAAPLAAAAAGCRPRDGSWRVVDMPEPDAAERAALWRTQAGPDGVALPDWHRHGPQRIAALGRIARQRAETAGHPVAGEDLAAALWQVQEDLGQLAQPWHDRIPDEALVLPSAVHEQLALIEQRCRLRQRLLDGLGVATRSRRRTGVVCCFHGPSGTGKSLAASWLATRLDLPLYAVDVSALSSKYIGETEKNLSRLLDQAERSQVVLLFDEADALFAQRTDVRDANDRYANQLTNYLLQRLEAFDGIAVLTANSLGRIDQAFLRRLDHVCAFPAPEPLERRELWLRHLGPDHQIDDRLLNRLATLVELPGGAIRKAVLGAAVRACGAERAIGPADLLAAIADEYRTLGKDLPRGLQEARV